MKKYLTISVKRQEYLVMKTTERISTFVVLLKSAIFVRMTVITAVSDIQTATVTDTDFQRMKSWNVQMKAIDLDIEHLLCRGVKTESLNRNIYVIL